MTRKAIITIEIENNGLHASEGWHQGCVSIVLQVGGKTFKRAWKKKDVGLWGRGTKKQKDDWYDEFEGSGLYGAAGAMESLESQAMDLLSDLFEEDDE